MAAKSIATLAIKIIADAAGLQVGFSKAEKSVQQFSNQVKGMAGTIGGLLGIGSASAIGAWAVKLAADLETTKIAFEVMTGSAEKAAAIVEDMRQFGAVTPFQAADLLDATKVMMQFGIEADQATAYLKMLSNVAAGDANKLSHIALVFGQINAAGRLMGQDLLQLVNSGFNPLQEISRKTGESMASLRKRMEQGQISFQMVADAFKSATGEGGRFFQMNERMSETLAGKWSTLKDEAAMLATTLGEQLIPSLKDMMEAVKPLIQGVGALANKWNQFANTTLGRVSIRAMSGLSGAFQTFGDPQGTVNYLQTGNKTAESALGGVFKSVPQAEAATGSLYDRTIAWFDGLKQSANGYVNSIQAIADRMNDLAKSADKLRESLRTPFENARDAMNELKAMAAFGLGDPDFFARAAVKVKTELMDALKAQRGIKDLGNTGGVGALQRGTSGAFSAVQAAGREFRDMVTRQAEQIKLQAEANALLAKIEGKEPIQIAEASL